MQLRRILFFAPLLAGCYEYQPISTTTAPTGQDVRLTLTDAGSADMAPALGPSVEEVGGKLVKDSGDAYTVALSESRRRNGIEMDWRGEEVSISKALVSSIQLRKFSPARTTVVGVGLVAALFVIQRSIWGPGGVFGGGSPGPPPTPK